MTYPTYDSTYFVAVPNPHNEQLMADMDSARKDMIDAKVTYAKAQADAACARAALVAAKSKLTEAVNRFNARDLI